MAKVLIVGDSRRMKGGVNTVLRIMEDSYLWDKYRCYWVECQINSTFFMKILYLIRGLIIGLILVPRYDLVNFHTTPTALRRLFPLFFFAFLLKKKIILHLHVGNQLEHFQHDRLFIYCCKKASRIITLGATWMEYIPIDDKSKVDFIYNPAPPIEEPTDGQHYFLFAAFLDKDFNKGYDTLIEGYAKVVKKYPDWKLVVCGTGEVDSLKNIINKYGIEDKVETPGWVEGEVKKNYFKNSYAYVMTSIMEGLPLSVLESMSYGKPIITTPVGCIPEFLSNRESALIFDFKDADALAKCMEELIVNRELYKQLVNKEQQIIEEKFTREKFLNKMDRLYQSTLRYILGIR